MKLCKVLWIFLYIQRQSVWIGNIYYLFGYFYNLKHLFSIRRWQSRATFQQLADGWKNLPCESSKDIIHSLTNDLSTLLLSACVQINSGHIHHNKSMVNWSFFIIWYTSGFFFQVLLLAIALYHIAQQVLIKF